MIYVVVTDPTVSAIQHGPHPMEISPGLYVDAAKTHPFEREAGLLYVLDEDDRLLCVSTRDPRVVLVDESVINMIRSSGL